jgi:tRNA threonylcarbamoyladenosine biosynthesis protein TsaE
MTIGSIRRLAPVAPRCRTEAPQLRTAPHVTFAIDLPNAAATEALARALAPHLGAGDTLALDGDLGVGKSLFARALISARLAQLGRAEDIPSPTYTLVQTYDVGAVQIWHADLYRLAGPDEIIELGLEEAFDTAITLVEWPDRLGELLPDRRLTLAFSFAPGDDARAVTLTASGPGWDWTAQVLAKAAR